jgi:hypothetical protein
MLFHKFSFIKTFLNITTQHICHLWLQQGSVDGNLSHTKPASAIWLLQHLRAQTTKGIILIINENNYFQLLYYTY